VGQASKEGYLVKQGGRWRSWKRRWFVLRNTTLYYFSAPSVRDPLGYIPLAPSIITALDDNGTWCLAISRARQGTTTEAVEPLLGGDDKGGAATGGSGSGSGSPDAMSDRKYCIKITHPNGFSVRHGCTFFDALLPFDSIRFDSID